MELRHSRTAGGFVAGVVVAVFAAITLLVPRAVHAQDNQPVSHNEQGKALLKAGNVEDAIAVWREGFLAATGEELVKLAKNLGIAHLKLKRYAQAHYYLNYYLLLCDADSVRAQKAKISIELVEEELVGRVLVKLTTVPADAVVYVDGISPANRYRPPVAWRFVPGPHKFTVMKDGMIAEELEFTVAANEQLDLTAKLEREATPLVEPAIPDPDDPAIEQPDPGLEILTATDLAPNTTARKSPWPWVTLGTGVAGALVGGILEYVAYSRNQDLGTKYQTRIDQGEAFDSAQQGLNKEYDDKVKPLNNAGIALLAVGSTAVVGGIIWAIADTGQKEEETQLQVVPVAAPDTVGFMLDLRF